MMLLDTSGLVCYLDKADPRHSEAVSLLHSARRRITHNYVLAELVAVCNARRMNRRGTLDFVDELCLDPEINIEWVAAKEHLAAMQLLRQRGDKNYSLCDAISFGLMRRHRITEAFSTDHHFEQEGFTRLLRG
jgi:predicted nucleic acid-binding protein